MKRKNLFYCLAHAVVQLKSDAGLRFLLAAFEFESQLDEKQFFKDQTDVRRRSRRLQGFEAFSSFGPMNFPQRLALRNQCQALAHGLRNGFCKFRSEVFQSGANDAAK